MGCVKERKGGKSRGKRGLAWVSGDVESEGGEGDGGEMGKGREDDGMKTPRRDGSKKEWRKGRGSRKTRESIKTERMKRGKEKKAVKKIWMEEEVRKRKERRHDRSKRGSKIKEEKEKNVAT